MKILLSGTSGLIGTALQEHLSSKGHDIRPLLRDHHQNDLPYWDIENNKINLSGFEPEAVVHLAGEGIANRRWTASQKDRILNSRVAGTRLLVEHLTQMKNPPKVLLSASAIGYYGLQNKEVLDETSPPGTAFVSRICIPWEAETLPAKEAGIRVVNLRTGIVISEKGGALAKMLPPFKFGLGGVIGTGRQYMSWVSIVDIINMLEFCLNNDDIMGPANLTAPNPVTNAEFTKTLGEVLQRPTLLPMPAMMIKILFGEMGQELLLGGARIIPQKLLRSGYLFKHTELKSALKESLSLK